ncbi:MAG: polyhydroxyalkanoic acid system family protein [Xanthomonadales bacterium]|nr:polyhydroxyalkanoic acid system family protein [Xanthomonadales bacterium]
MSQIYISKKHSCSNSEAKEIADEIALTLSENYSIDYEWTDDVLYFERSGVYGQIEISKDNILVQAELSFPVNLLQGRIEAEINKVVDAHFSA